MSRARVFLDHSQPAAEALARGQVLGSAVSAERPVALYAAPLELAAVALGAYQHAGHALDPEPFAAMALPVLRRRSGGAAVWAGDGVVYFALGLHDASALMSCPRGKLLNRNVRGMLAGLRGIGVPTHYFGRDFLSFTADPGVYVGWDEAEDGGVLLEAFVALETPFVLPAALSGYPTSGEPPLRGKEPSTLRKAGAKQSAREVQQALVDGYARGFELDLDDEPPTETELSAIAQARAGLAVDLHDDRGLCWSQPVAEAIGFISAGARREGGGTIADVALGGDFFQHRSCPAQLRSALIGGDADPDRVGLAIDRVYAARPGLIEGVRSLGKLQAALLDALGRAIS
jgi:hypothetical protein